MILLKAKKPKKVAKKVKSLFTIGSTIQLRGIKGKAISGEVIGTHKKKIHMCVVKRGEKRIVVECRPKNPKKGNFATKVIVHKKPLSPKAWKQ